MYQHPLEDEYDPRISIQFTQLSQNPEQINRLDSLNA